MKVPVTKPRSQDVVVAEQGILRINPGASQDDKVEDRA